VKREVALFKFAYHRPGWLDEIHANLRPEKWGKNLKVLELYLRSNFEIAKQQGKVLEDEANGRAIWRAGHLVTPAMDPVWLYYERNDERYDQKWRFQGVLIGPSPLEGIHGEDHTVTYSPPEFNPSWEIYIDPYSFQQHILVHNKARLVAVLGEEIASNSHLVFRLIYGEIMLARKEAAGIMPQWYMNGYNFLMPLFLTSPNKVDLTAALMINETMKRYELKTLLPPSYAYANARAVVRSPVQFASWIALDDDTDIDEYEDEDE
jgi:hypothetical protein